MKKQVKALVLLSGGLDSMLAVKLLQEQGIEVEGLTFVSYFFNDRAAKKAVEQLGIKLRVIDFSKEQLAVVKNPRHGYGKNMNPCLDCHILMLKKAAEIMKKENSCPERSRRIDFIATGEVLGERPMSQNKQSLAIVEKEAGLKGYLLRPLSAKLLPPTKPEIEGRVDRDKLSAISGRRRTPQLTLAKKHGLKEFPSPAGGCLLTDPEFGKRLKKLLEIMPSAGEDDIYLLKYGRHIWSEHFPKEHLPRSDFGRRGILFVVGRDHEENLIIKKLARKNNLLAEAAEIPGPIILVRNFGKGKLEKEKIAGQVREFLVKYNRKARLFKNISVKWIANKKKI